MPRALQIFTPQTMIIVLYKTKPIYSKLKKILQTVFLITETPRKTIKICRSYYETR